MARGSSQTDFKLSSSFAQKVELPPQSGFQKVGIGRAVDLTGTEPIDVLQGEEALFNDWTKERTPEGITRLENVYKEMEQYIAAFAQQEAARVDAGGSTNFTNKGTKGVFSHVEDVDGQKMQFLIPEATVRLSREPIEPREGMVVKRITINRPEGVKVNESALRAIGLQSTKSLWFTYPDPKNLDLRVKALD